VNGSISIGALARSAGVSTRTIRYWEELGLLPEPPRSPGGTRRYPREAVSHVEAIQTLKELGFRLEGMGPLAAAIRGQAACEADRAGALALLDHCITSLTEQVTRLQKLRDMAGADG
jgi:DNA-binding transcriptional MerR regulator